MSVQRQEFILMFLKFKKIISNKQNHFNYVDPYYVDFEAEAKTGIFTYYSYKGINLSSTTQPLNLYVL